jgi:hypothetical protein
MDRHTDKRTDRIINGETYRYTEKQTEGLTDRQKDK